MLTVHVIYVAFLFHEHVKNTKFRNLYKICLAFRFQGRVFIIKYGFNFHTGWHKRYTYLFGLTNVILSMVMPA